MEYFWYLCKFNEEDYVINCMQRLNIVNLKLFRLLNNKF